MFNNKKVYFTSDTHFFHKKSIIYDNRPFVSIEDMHETFIENWNNVVPEDGMVFHLGDFGFKGDYDDILNRLNGKIFLIEGNHDNLLIKKNKIIPNTFISIVPYYEFNDNGTTFILCHYPIERWNQQRFGSIHLHGHAHFNEVNKIKNRMNVFIGLNNWKPFRFDEILLILRGDVSEKTL